MYNYVYSCTPVTVVPSYEGTRYSNALYTVHIPLLRDSTVRIERLCSCPRLTVVGPRAVRDGHTGHHHSLLEIVCLFVVTSREKEEVAPFQLFSCHG